MGGIDVLPFIKGKKRLNISKICHAQEDYGLADRSLLKELKKDHKVVGYRTIYNFIKLGKVRIMVLAMRIETERIREDVDNLRSDDVVRDKILDVYSVDRTSF